MMTRIERVKEEIKNMHVIFIRHAEPNFNYVTRRQLIGIGRDLAELSTKGIQQAEVVSHNET